MARLYQHYTSNTYFITHHVPFLLLLKIQRTRKHYVFSILKLNILRFFKTCFYLNPIQILKKTPTFEFSTLFLLIC